MTKAPRQAISIWTILAALLFAFAFTGGLWVLITRHQKAERTAYLQAAAEETARAVSDFRAYYSQNIVTPMRRAGIEITHDHAERPHALPLPATMSMELGSYMSRRGEAIDVRMVSEHPFAWRRERSLDDFQRSALRTLSVTEGQCYQRYETDAEGRLLFRLAKPVRMEPSCVGCHNERLDSPRRDWQVGDLRGIQEISIDVERFTAATDGSDRSFRQIIWFTLIAFGLAVALLLWLAERNRRSFATISRLADNERERGVELARAEDAARRSADQYAAILAGMSEAVISTDREGRIASANPAASEIFGYDLDDLIGMAAADLLQAPASEQYRNMFAEILARGEDGVMPEPLSGIPGRHKDGGTRVLRASFSMTDVHGDRLFTAVISDQTEASHSRARIAELQQRLLSAIEAVPDAFVLYDANDRLVLCNEKYREFYPTSSDLLTEGTPFETIIRTGAERGQYREAEGRIDDWVAERMAAHRDPQGAVEQHLDDGRWLRVEERRTADGGIVGFRTDITALKNREAELRESIARIGATLESALDCIISIDKHGRILEFNPAAERTFGFARADVLGERMVDLIVPAALREAHEQGMARFLETGEGPVIGARIEIEAVDAGGRQFPIELAVNAIEGRDGPEFIAYLRDITERRQAEQDLEDARQRAEEANRAKGRFLAMMSHEIRTPLNAVLGALGLLDDRDLTDEQRQFVRVGRTSAEALLAIINDILDFSKLEAGKLSLEPTVFALSDLLGTVSEVLQPRVAETGVALETRIDPALPGHLRGDFGRLRQVLLNLGGNAAKFTERGSIEIAVAPAPAYEPRQADEVALRFEVRDSGPGIAPERQMSLFDEFASFSPGHQGGQGGTGLGLAICKSLVSVMEGEIGVISVPHQAGATFWFEVVLAAAPAPAVEAVAPPVPAQTDIERGHIRVLMAEDNPANQLITRLILEKAGFRVDVVGDGAEAVKAVRLRPYDVILMDVGMPVMDGRAATAAIRQLPDPERQRIPIIATTAHVMDSERSQILASGMNDFVAKPIDRALLIATLDRWTRNTPAVETGGLKGPAPDDALFDEGNLQSLASDSGPAVIAHLVQVFEADLQASLAKVRAALKAEDAAEVEALAHRMGSGAGNFGAMRFFRACRTIEADLQADRRVEAFARAADLPVLGQATIEALTQFLGRLREAEIEAGKQGADEES